MRVGLREVGTGPARLLRALVSLHVQGQVVRAREAAAAHGALERLGARVLPEVARQLVGPGEAPLASLPGALVRLLSCSGKGGKREKRMKRTE